MLLNIYFLILFHISAICIAFLLTTIPVDCSITFLRFPLPHPSNNSSSYIWLLSVNGLPFVKQRQRRKDENLDRTTSYPTPTAVEILMPQTAPRTNRLRRRRAVVVSSSLWYNPITKTMTMVSGRRRCVWRCLERTMRLLLLPRALLLRRYVVGALVWRLKRTIND